MNHEQVILKHFRRYKYLSAYKAVELYGITRLSARIYDLRRQGYVIQSIRRDAINRYGNPVSYFDYFLISSPKKKGR